MWVSEVMLQQTQVATVIPYYRRFLRAFPTLARLAQSPLERVLEIWSGLGYYRRARYLHLAAQTIAQKLGGRFPRHYGKVRSLPGIGEYTARAVSSIAYNLPYTVLDGNVARVVARLRALRGNLQQPRFRHNVEQELRLLLSRRQPGNFNQALMELGQTVCLPRAPRCLACPLRKWCQAYRRGTAEAYPAPRRRRATEFRYLATAIIVAAQAAPGLSRAGPGQPRKRFEVLMARGLDEGLLGDLWNFPAAFGKSRADAVTRLRDKLAAVASGLVLTNRPFTEVRHSITYRSIHVQLYRATAAVAAHRPSPPRPTPALVFSSLRHGPAVEGHLLRWFSLARLPQAAVSQLARKIAAAL